MSENERLGIIATIERLAADYKVSTAEEKQAKSKKENAKSKMVELLKKLGVNEVKAGMYSVKNTPYEKFTFREKDFKAEHADIAYEYTTVSEATRFTVN